MHRAFHTATRMCVSDAILLCNCISYIKAKHTNSLFFQCALIIYMFMCIWVYRVRRWAPAPDRSLASHPPTACAAARSFSSVSADYVIQKSFAQSCQATHVPKKALVSRRRTTRAAVITANSKLKAGAHTRYPTTTRSLIPSIW